MNSYLASKMPSFFVVNLRNSQLIAYRDVGKGREQDAEALRAIHASNLNILNHNILRSE